MALSSHGKYLENKFRYKSASMAIYEDAKQNYIRISKELSNMLSMKSGSFRYDMIVIGLILTVLVSILEVYLNNFCFHIYLLYFSAF